jgi:predicted transcriptional regulator
LTVWRDAAILFVEVSTMVRLTIRISEELHEKLRWLAYKERRSQQVLLEELLEKALADIEVPKEAKG